MSDPTHFPLCWPPTIPRAKAREKGLFKTTLAAALSNVEGSLRLFGQDAGKPVSNIILSSNVSLGCNNPEDPGIAAWFSWDGLQICIPVDRYLTPAANLQAIHHIIDARRVELRHGTLSLVRASFQGFRALPNPAGKRSWREVLQLADSPTAADVNTAYRTLAAKAHPDKPGGSHEKMAELTAARDAALREIAS